MTSPPPLLELTGVCKQFPGVLALDNVGLTLRQGEMLALIGENGAGKSTLMKVLGGIYHPDAGQILIDDQAVVIDSVHDAMRVGIALIHQELNLSDNLDIGANVFLGREPRKMGPLKFVDRKTINEKTSEILGRLGMNDLPTRLVRELSIGQQQMVEIAKALSMNARILILDEPTSSLSQHETENLFRILGELKAQGVSMIYISHRLGEIIQMADRVSAMRDGKNSGDLEKSEITRDNMVRLMIGRDINQFYHHRQKNIEKPMLEVRELLVPGSRSAQPISFQLRKGEILGVAGLVGAGRTELAETLFGIRKPLAGQILVDGLPQTISNPRDAIRAGLALVPEDRKQQGLIVEMSVRENTSLAGLKGMHAGGFIRHRAERFLAQAAVEKLAIKTPHIEQLAQLLSGGNQQKIVLGKWLALSPKVLILDEPTRGIDVVAKEEIYRLMERLAADGMAILMISSEMQEVLGISDRVMVMHEGRLAGELTEHDFSEEAVMQLATGADK